MVKGHSPVVKCGSIKIIDPIPRIKTPVPSQYGFLPTPPKYDTGIRQTKDAKSYPLAIKPVSELLRSNRLSILLILLKTNPFTIIPYKVRSMARIAHNYCDGVYSTALNFCD